jgi:AAA domain
MKTEQILAKLQGVSGTGNGWQARCPAHSDTHPSLSIATDGGKTLLCCHAGCSTGSIVSTIGLSMRDLFPEASKKRTLVETYDYVDESDKLLFQVVRYDPKDFRVRRFVNNRWVYSLGDIEPVPYQLSEVLECRKLWVTEGEKDADVGRLDLKVYTTTNPFGAGNWREDYAHYFAGKVVRLISHNDEAGRKHMRAVACSLFAEAKTVKIVELPFGTDLAEWHALGGTREELVKLANDAPAVSAEQIEQWQSSNADDSELRLKSLQQLMAEPQKQIKWVVQGLCPAGGTSLLVAKPKAGKSTLARCLGYAVASGKKFLGRKTLQGPVLYLAPQEIESEVRAHFEKLGATGAEPIHFCFVIPSKFGVAELENAIKKYNPALVVMDQLLHFLNVRDENKYAEVTKALQPFEALARRSGVVHILMTSHAGKSEKQDTGDNPLGSTAFFGAVDTLLVLKRLPTYRTLQTRQRYKDHHGDLPETILQFDEDRGAMSLGDARSAVEAERIAEQIVDFLSRRRTKWYREDKILSHIEGSQAFKRKALRDLHKAKQIVRSGRGRRSHPYLYSIR